MIPLSNSCRTNVRTKLLAWYDQHARILPWRVGPVARQLGNVADPYHVWLSEVMLQQTTVATVGGFYSNFVQKWPTIGDLAAADEEDVLKAWAGLGYYSRARNLKICADLVARQHGGRFPDTAEKLRALPGIGEYTAAAIAAIAFDRAEPVVDANIERIVARLQLIEEPLPKSKPIIKKQMTALVSRSRPGDFVQAMMDLGALICTPRKPSCNACPLAGHCRAGATGEPARWPLKLAKKTKPERQGAAFIVRDKDGAILLRKRNDRGLLAGMSEVPTTNWTAKQDGGTSVKEAPFSANWHACGTIRHTFTHFHLTLHIFAAEVSKQTKDRGWWSKSVEQEALPTVFKKAIRKAVDAENSGDLVPLKHSVMHSGR